MENAIYPCAQKDLYPACRLAWQSCTENLPAFEDYKTNYTPAFITARLAAISTAELLKSLQARTLASEGYHADLVEMANTDRENFQTLKRYIAEAFPPERQKMQYEAAGQEYYLKASQNNWAAVESLNTMAHLYITEFETILTTAGFMPPAFVTKFNNDRIAFAAKHLLFMNQEETDEEGTKEKIIANNGIYTDVIKLCLDGQEIFKNDEVMRKQFTFAEILARVAGPGQAGLRGLLKSALDAQPVSEAVVMILETSDTTNGEPDGHYLLKPVPSGTYTVRVTAPGYRDKVIHNVVISIGVVSTLDIELDPE